jgi:hypothetical protein
MQCELCSAQCFNVLYSLSTQFVHHSKKHILSVERETRYYYLRKMHFFRFHPAPNLSASNSSLDLHRGLFFAHTIFALFIFFSGGKKYILGFQFPKKRAQKKHTPKILVNKNFFSSCTLKCIFDSANA